MTSVYRATAQDNSKETRKLRQANTFSPMPHSPRVKNQQGKAMSQVAKWSFLSSTISLGKSNYFSLSMSIYTSTVMLLYNKKWNFIPLLAPLLPQDRWLVDWSYGLDVTFAGIAKNAENTGKINVLEMLLCGSLALSALELSFWIGFPVLDIRIEMFS